MSLSRHCGLLAASTDVSQVLRTKVREDSDLTLTAPDCIQYLLAFEVVHSSGKPHPPHAQHSGLWNAESQLLPSAVT